MGDPVMGLGAVDALSGVHSAVLAVDRRGETGLGRFRLAHRALPGLDLAEVARALATLPAATPALRFTRAAEVIERTRRRHRGLAGNFLGALARAQHDPRVARLLAEGFRHTRPNLAAVLGLGDDPAGLDAAGLVHSMFTGLLFQQLLDPGLGIEGDRLEAAKVRLRRVLPE